MSVTPVAEFLSSTFFPRVRRGSFPKSLFTYFGFATLVQPIGPDMPMKNK